MCKLTHRRTYPNGFFLYEMQRTSMYRSDVFRFKRNNSSQKRCFELWHARLSSHTRSYNEDKNQDLTSYRNWTRSWSVWFYLVQNKFCMNFRSYAIEILLNHKLKITKTKTFWSNWSTFWHNSASYIIRTKLFLLYIDQLNHSIYIKFRHLQIFFKKKTH